MWNAVPWLIDYQAAKMTQRTYRTQTVSAEAIYGHFPRINNIKTSATHST